MKVGDLVRYSGSSEGSNVIGIVTEVYTTSTGEHGACVVQWSNGVVSNHSRSWLVKMKTSEDT